MTTAEDARKLKGWFLENAGLEAKSLPIAIQSLWMMDRERWEAYEREHTPNNLEEGVELVLSYLEAAIITTAAQVAGPPAEECLLSPSPPAEGECLLSPCPPAEGECLLVLPPQPKREAQKNKEVKDWWEECRLRARHPRRCNKPSPGCLLCDQDHLFANCPFRSYEEEPERSQPKGEEPERPQPKGEEPECPTPEWEEPERPQPKRGESVRPQPKGEEPERSQPKGEEPERSQPKGEEPERSQPKGEEPERSQPKGEEPERPQPKREESVRPQPKEGGVGASIAQEGEGRACTALGPKAPAEDECLLVTLPPPSLTPAREGDKPQSPARKAEPHQSPAREAEQHQSPAKGGDYTLLPPPSPGDYTLLPPSSPGDHTLLPPPLLPPQEPEGEELQAQPPEIFWGGEGQDAGVPQQPLFMLLKAARRAQAQPPQRREPAPPGAEELELPLPPPPPGAEELELPLPPPPPGAEELELPLPPPPPGAEELELPLPPPPPGAEELELPLPPPPPGAEELELPLPPVLPLEGVRWPEPQKGELPATKKGEEVWRPLSPAAVSLQEFLWPEPHRRELPAMKKVGEVQRPAPTAAVSLLEGLWPEPHQWELPATKKGEVGGPPAPAAFSLQVGTSMLSAVPLPAGVLTAWPAMGPVKPPLPARDFVLDCWVFKGGGGH
ncbi:UNVERIFIED_CONTAM: hypothetical protein FKN15_023192 [Acipenser sinensis]